MRYVTADHHFFHERIIKYCHRPFRDVQMMNIALADHWNDMINPEDEVYFLGDFGMAKGPKGEWKLEQLFKQLNGIKYLVVGSHDKDSMGLPWKEIIRENLFLDGVLLTHDGDTHRKRYESAQSRNFPIFCVSPGTRILTSDLRWTAAENLVAGNSLIGFDEGTSRQHRCFRPSVVLQASIQSDPIVQVITNIGELKISKNHQFLIQRYRTIHDHSTEWCQAGLLNPGMRLVYMGTPWDIDTSYESGWLAGFAAGEGSVSKQSGLVELINTDLNLIDYASNILINKGYKIRIDERKRAENRKRVYRIQLTHVSDSRRFLGSIRPLRLSTERAWNGRRIGSREVSVNYPIVQSVEKVRKGDVINLTTSTGTYFAEGYASHNCGHVHDIWKAKHNMLNVGVDVWHFRPLEWSFAKAFWQSRYDYEKAHPGEY